MADGYLKKCNIVEDGVECGKYHARALHEQEDGGSKEKAPPKQEWKIPSPNNSDVRPNSGENGLLGDAGPNKRFMMRPIALIINLLEEA